MKHDDGFLISQYIDNELDIEEKETFVLLVHGDQEFFVETIDLLKQEKRIRVPAPEFAEPAPVIRKRPGSWRVLRPAVFIPVSLAAAILIFLVSTVFWPAPMQQAKTDELMPYRFVLYMPEAQDVEVAGSFSAWERMKLHPAGKSGYWELTLNLPKGEYRYAYILDGGRRLPDPTVPAQEVDDFGGENSIISVAGI